MSSFMTRPEIVAALEAKGWKDATEPWTPGNAYISADNEIRLDIESDGYWIVGRFTDSDVNGVAVGRYRSIDEGEDLSEVLEAVKCAEMGIPRDVDERDVDVDEGTLDLERRYEYADQKLTGMMEDGDDSLRGSIPWSSSTTTPAPKPPPAAST